MVLASLAAMVSLAGCAGGRNPLHAARDAASTTLGLTAQSTLTLTDARLFGGTPGTILGRAQYAFPKGLGYAALQVPADGARAAGPAYLVFLPQQLWSRPVTSSSLPKGRLWISATFGSAPSPATAPLALALETLNPQLLLEEIATGAVSAKASGHRVVNHVPFSEYAVTVDLTRSLAAVKGTALRAAIRQELRAARGPRVQVVAGVDGSGRVANLEASLPGSQLGTVRFTLARFGSTIPLSLPLPSQTVDVASLGGAAGARRAFTGG
jgi:hypothetical protein